MSPAVKRLTSWLRPAPSPDMAGIINESKHFMAERAADKARIAALSDAIQDFRLLETLQINDEKERESEILSALAMGGSGPWQMPKELLRLPEATEGGGIRHYESARDEERGVLYLREVSPVSAQGAYGDIELALQNMDWRREINFSWLEFSRWGIQQIILISRLYFLKNPLIQRGINVSAHYVFGRGVEVSSPDQDANDVLKEFFERNKKTLGQIALTDLERRKYYDGNLFFVFFVDKADSGQVTVRTIDATEIMDVVTDPDDTDTPWLYKRVWTRRTFDIKSGTADTSTHTEWYPALGCDPELKPASIQGAKINWDAPILHRKCGAPGKWHFGCPLVYAALDWAKAATKFLENCATISRALAQFALTFTSKGGQQALQGYKQQMSTTVGANASLWDQNPPAVAASTFASGPGTKIEAFKTQGAGLNPDQVRQSKLQVAMVFGLPESFFGDLSTGNLATATSLDRPTQLNFLEKQEAWREDLTTIAKFVLQSSFGASNGKLREAMERRKVEMKMVSISEARRVHDPNPLSIGLRYEAKKKAQPDHEIEVMVTFPAIIEADVPARVGAIVNAMTLGNKSGEVVGIDEKAGVGMLYQEVGYENSEELLEEQYPEGEYDPDRTKEPEPAPVAPPQPGTQPNAKSSLSQAVERLNSALRLHPGVDLREDWVTIDGAHVFINDEGTITKGPAALLGKSHKSVIAQKHQVKTTKAQQDLAERSEVRLAHAIGFEKSADNRPFDLFKGKVAIEVKSLIHGKNGKITMKADALARKSAYMKENGITHAYTVAVDLRGGRQTAQYYVSEKLGSLRLGSMTPVTLPELKTMVREHV